MTMGVDEKADICRSQVKCRIKQEQECEQGNKSKSGGRERGNVRGLMTKIYPPGERVAREQPSEIFSKHNSEREKIHRIDNERG
jgi:hypothetical protein